MFFCINALCGMIRGAPDFNCNPVLAEILTPILTARARHSLST